MRDTLIKFWDMGIQRFLIFGDNCRIFFKDMGYFLKKLMGYWDPPPSRASFICLPFTKFLLCHASVVLGGFVAGYPHGFGGLAVLGFALKEKFRYTDFFFCQLRQRLSKKIC